MTGRVAEALRYRLGPPAESLLLALAARITTKSYIGVDYQQYAEIGSGVSTRFVRRAITDGRGRTNLTSIDPEPRFAIDRLCDTVVRSRLENVEVSMFDALGDGDVVFFDGTHRAFPNSDVTTLFLDVLPRLSRGVLVAVHDVYLPDDYPPEFAAWYLSEQYLLAAYVLAGTPWLRWELPCYFASSHPRLSVACDRVVSRAGADKARSSSFWFSVTSCNRQ